MTGTPIPSDVVALPGYRRHLRVEPGEGRVRALLEDDLHCMKVMLRHDAGVVVAVEAETLRAPWDTCPGARDRLVETFLGQPLAEVTARRDKKANCTHLHDLAVLAAAHAFDAVPTLFEIFASDPVAGERILEIRRNGQMVHRWHERDGLLVSPDLVAGQTLLSLRERIAAIAEPPAREAARLLQWGGLVAHGRTMPAEQQSRATDMPASCYTFQPARAAIAKRIAFGRDFSESSLVPLGIFENPVKEQAR